MNSGQDPISAYDIVVAATAILGALTGCYSLWLQRKEAHSANAEVLDVDVFTAYSVQRKIDESGPSFSGFITNRSRAPVYLRSVSLNFLDEEAVARYRHSRPQGEHGILGIRTCFPFEVQCDSPLQPREARQVVLHLDPKLQLELGPLLRMQIPCEVVARTTTGAFHWENGPQKLETLLRCWDSQQEFIERLIAREKLK